MRATMSWGNHFGVVEIDWTKTDPLLRLQIRDEAGEMAFQHKVPLSALSTRRGTRRSGSSYGPYTE